MYSGCSFQLHQTEDPIMQGSQLTQVRDHSQPKEVMICPIFVWDRVHFLPSCLYSSMFYI